MAKDSVHRYKEIRLGQLRAFCECARHRSFSAAARVLGLSHPSVLQQVRALERDFGVTLLQRHGREMRPTEDGRVLLEMASSIVGSVDSLRETFEQRRGDVPRTLTVVGTPGVIGEDLSRPIVAFCKLHPNIKMNLISNSHIDRTLDLIVSGDADMAIMPLDLVEPAASDRIVGLEPLCIRPASLLVPHGHPLASRRRTGLADLIRHPLILPEPDATWRGKVDRIFDAAGLLDRVQILLETSLIHATRRFVSLGLGPALLALPRDGLRHADILIRPMTHLFPSEPITIVWRRGAPPRPQARHFVDFVRAQIAPEVRPP